MEKKKGRQEMHLSMWLFLSLGILMCVGIFLYDFSNQMDYQIRQIISDHLRDVAVQSADAVEKELCRVQDEVRFTADYLAEAGEIPDEEVDLLLNHMKEKCRFTDVRLVSGDGRLFSIERKQMPASAGGYVEKILEGKSGITDLFRSNISGKEVFVVYSPVIRDGTVLGGIVGTTVVDQMIDFIDSTGFNSRCYSYVVKTDGTLIAQTTHPESLYDGRAYFYFLDGLTDERSITSEQLEASMERRERGMFNYRIGNQSRISYYTPIHVNNWYVLTMVQSQAAEQYISTINFTAFQLTLKVAAVFLMVSVIVILWFRKINRIISKSKAELELGNQKLKLALAHSTNTIFEYLVKEDRINFISFSDTRCYSIGEVLDHATQAKPEQDFVDSSCQDRLLQALKDACVGRKVITEEFLAGPIFGEDVWFRMTLDPMCNANGDTVEVIGTVEDITEEMRIRRRYVQEEQYRSAILSEAVALWSVDLVREQMMTYSLRGEDQMAGKTSIPYDDHLMNRLCGRIISEDREKVWKFLQVSNLLAAYYTGQREQKELFRIVVSDTGEFRWVNCSISLLGDPSTGNPLAFAYLKDVDEEIRLAHSWERDPLTGLYNRRNIDKKVTEALKEKAGLSCMMMMDLDGFKEVNDRFGHQEGDQVLKRIGQILTEAFRADDLVARLGGDEFLVFLSCLQDENAACQRAEDVRERVYDMKIEKNIHDVSISIGIAFAPRDGETFETLYKKADEALYQAKRSGKNQIQCYKKE